MIEYVVCHYSIYGAMQGVQVNSTVHLNCGLVVCLNSILNGNQRPPVSLGIN